MRECTLLTDTITKMRPTITINQLTTYLLNKVEDEEYKDRLQIHYTFGHIII